MTDVPIVPRDHWLGVELRHLAALAAVAEEGSFRGAAQRLGYVQSAVSQQIAFLERLVGVRLLERSRGPRPVSVTEAGRVLLDHADGILSRLRAARADLDALNEGSVGEVRVGVDPVVARRVLPGVLGELMRRRPGVRVIPVEATGAEHRVSLVEHGEIDLSFVDLPLAGGWVESWELLRDPMVLLVERRSPLVTLERAPTAAEIASLEIIASPDVRPRAARIRSELPVSTLQALVGAGQGAAILPSLAVDPHDPATVAIGLNGHFPPRVLGLCRQRDRLPAEPIQAFGEAATAWAAARAAAPEPEPAPGSSAPVA